MSPLSPLLSPQVAPLSTHSSMWGCGLYGAMGWGRGSGPKSHPMPHNCVCVFAPPPQHCAPPTPLPLPNEVSHYWGSQPPLTALCPPPPLLALPCKVGPYLGSQPPPPLWLCVMRRAPIGGESPYWGSQPLFGVTAGPPPAAVSPRGSEARMGGGATLGEGGGKLRWGGGFVSHSAPLGCA